MEVKLLASGKKPKATSTPQNLMVWYNPHSCHIAGLPTGSMSGKCLFTVISKHLDWTVFTVRRIYLVGLVLLKKVRILFVSPSSGKVTFPNYFLFHFRILIFFGQYNFKVSSY